MAFLKPSLPENEHVVLEMTARLGQESGNFGPKFKYQFAWNNRPFDHDASMNEEKVLQKAMPGMKLQAKKVKNPHGTGFMIYWDILTESEVARAATNTNSVQVPPASVTLPNPVPQKTPDWDKIALSKIVHEYMKAGYSLGKDPALCAADAKELTKLQYTTVDQLVKDLTPSDFAQDEDRSLGY